MVGVRLFIYNYFLGWWGDFLGYAAVKIYRE